MFYSQIIEGGSPDDCDRCNVKEPLLLLSKAKKDGSPFILMSRDFVFDMSIPRVYTEHTPSNAVSVAGQMLAITERAVADYELGIVFRVQVPLREVTTVILDAVHRGCRSMADQTICPVSIVAVEALGDLFFHDPSRWDGRRIVNVVLGEVHSVAGMIYNLLEDEDFIDLDGEPLFSERRASFFGNNLRETLSPIELINLQVLNERDVREEMASWKNITQE